MANSRDISYKAEEFLERVLSNSFGISITVEAIVAKALPILARSLPQWGVPMNMMPTILFRMAFPSSDD